jgi:hypothetical protein
MAATSTSALDTSFVIVNQEFGVGQQVKFEPPTLPVVQEEVKVRIPTFCVEIAISRWFFIVKRSSPFE